MKIELERKEFYLDRCIGGIYIGGEFMYYTLEDTDRKLEEGGEKIEGQTAIPRGIHKIEIDWSFKRKALVPFLRDVPNFNAIQIHIANDPQDLEGCIGIGKTYDPINKRILNSTLACQEFYPKLLEIIIETKNDVWMEIK